MTHEAEPTLVPEPVEDMILSALHKHWLRVIVAAAD
jgi:hypothetical protein